VDVVELEEGRRRGGKERKGSLSELGISEQSMLGRTSSQNGAASDAKWRDDSRMRGRRCRFKNRRCSRRGALLSSQLAFERPVV
jgi:hypothetical protein